MEVPHVYVSQSAQSEGVSFQFFIVSAGGSIPSEYYDLWQVDAAAKEHGAQSVRDVKNFRVSEMGVRADSVRLDEKERDLLERRRQLYSPDLMDVFTGDRMEVLFAAAGGAIAFVRVVRPIILEWLRQRGNRNIKVKAAEFTVEIHGDHDVDALLRVLDEIAARQGPSQ